jgi:hypothetical protein
MAYKVCSHCQARVGVRTLKCSCGQAFHSVVKKPDVVKYLAPLSHEVSGKRKRRFETVDWRDLKPGDRIRIIGGSGPYYQADDGSKKTMTERGTYRVVSLDKLGINAIGMGKIAGHHHLYMGPHIKSPLFPGLYRRKHKFKRLRNGPT